jgi:hypothetical protein
MRNKVELYENQIPLYMFFGQWRQDDRGGNIPSPAEAAKPNGFLAGGGEE